MWNQFADQMDEHLLFWSSLASGEKVSKLDLCLSSGRQAQADPRDNVIPLSLLGRGVIDQHAVDVMAAEVAAVVPDFVFANTGNCENRGVTLLYSMPGGGFFFARKVAGVSPVLFGTD